MEKRPDRQVIAENSQSLVHIFHCHYARFWHIAAIIPVLTNSDNVCQMLLHVKQNGE